MISKRIEVGMKTFVMEYLNLYNNEILQRNYPYYQLVIDSDRDWYFDIWDGKHIRKDEGMDWSVGFSPEPTDFFYLYSFDAFEPQNEFIDANWNDSEFKRLLQYFSDDKERDALLHALRAPAGIVRHVCPDIEEARASKGNFWPTFWKITEVED